MNEQTQQQAFHQISERLAALSAENQELRARLDAADRISPVPMDATFQHISESLAALSTENQELRARLDSAARTTPTQMNATAPRAQEPKVQLPDKFSGKHSELRNFISAVMNVFELQPSRFPSDRIKTGFVGSLCNGDALSWYRVLLEGQSPILHDFAAFVTDLHEYFGDPFMQETARRQLLQLNQGQSSASAYASRFRRLSQDTGFNDLTLQYHFERGLSAEVRKAIAVNDSRFTSLDSLIKYSIKVDNRLFDARRSHQVHDSPPRRTLFNTSPISSPGPSPMEIGALTSPGQRKLTEDEKKTRREKGLCLYCGNSGHIARDCPVKQSSLPKNSQ